MWVFITQLSIFLDKIFQDESSDDEWCVHLATWQDETEEFCICPLIRITTSRLHFNDELTEAPKHISTLQLKNPFGAVDFGVLKGFMLIFTESGFQKFCTRPPTEPGRPQSVFPFFQDAGKQGKIMNHDVTKIYQPLMVIIYRVQRSSLIIFTPCIFTK